MTRLNNGPFVAMADCACLSSLITTGKAVKHSLVDLDANSRSGPAPSNIAADSVCVFSLLEHELNHLPSYSDLYRRWERQQWAAFELDLTVDRGQWQAATERDQKLFFNIGHFAGFYHSEAAVTDHLGPFLRAMPRPEQRLFLATQLADEARHTAFFDRFYHDVIGYDPGELGATLQPTDPWVSPKTRALIGDVLPEVADRVRMRPDELVNLVEGVTLYHLLIEGIVGLTSERLVLQGFKQLALFPGLRAGLAALVRDESRHILFGIRFLRDVVRDDGAFGSVIARSVERWLPLVLAVLAASPERCAALQAVGLVAAPSPADTLSVLRRRLRLIGLEMDLGIVNCREAS
jgi:ribonucleoside-diphosphate reductase beta chain